MTHQIIARILLAIPIAAVAFFFGCVIYFWGTSEKKQDAGVASLWGIATAFLVELTYAAILLWR